MNRQLTIKELSAYLPYNAQVLYSETNQLYPLVVHNGSVSIRGGLTINDLLESPLYKICLYPLSSLTKEITHNGETFVPLVKLFGYSRGTYDFEAKYVHTMASYEIQIEMLGYRNYFFSFRKDLDNDVRIDESFSHRFFCESRDLYQDDLITEEVKNQHYLFQKLLEWHIDIFNLIPSGLAIDKTTL